MSDQPKPISDVAKAIRACFRHTDDDFPNFDYNVSEGVIYIARNLGEIGSALDRIATAMEAANEIASPKPRLPGVER